MASEILPGLPEPGKRIRARPSIIASAEIVRELRAVLRREGIGLWCYRCFADLRHPGWLVDHDCLKERDENAEALRAGKVLDETNRKIFLFPIVQTNKQSAPTPREITSLGSPTYKPGELGKGLKRGWEWILNSYALFIFVAVIIIVVRKCSTA